MRGYLSLQDIRIPASVEIIGNECFRGCMALSSVIFESGSKLSQIGENVFDECYAMQSFMIPRSVVSVPKMWGSLASVKVRREAAASIRPPPRANKRRK
jgi:hypothetical protein